MSTVPVFLAGSGAAFAGLAGLIIRKVRGDRQRDAQRRTRAAFYRDRAERLAPHKPRTKNITEGRSQ